MQAEIEVFLREVKLMLTQCQGKRCNSDFAMGTMPCSRTSSGSCKMPLRQHAVMLLSETGKRQSVRHTADAGGQVFQKRGCLHIDQDSWGTSAEPLSFF